MFGFKRVTFHARCIGCNLCAHVVCFSRQPTSAAVAFRYLQCVTTCSSVKIEHAAIATTGLPMGSCCPGLRGNSSSWSSEIKPILLHHVVIVTCIPFLMSRAARSCPRSESDVLADLGLTSFKPAQQAAHRMLVAAISRHRALARPCDDNTSCIVVLPTSSGKDLLSFSVARAFSGTTVCFHPLKSLTGTNTVSYAYINECISTQFLRKVSLLEGVSLWYLW